MTQSKNTISQATFSPSDPSPRSLGGCQQSGTGVSCSLPVLGGDSFALGHEANLGCLEDAEGLKGGGEVASFCSLSPQYGMNASGIKLCR